MRKLCQISSTFFTWSFSWISLPWTCVVEILFLNDSKWNVLSLIYILPSHLLIHFRCFVITFSQGQPTIFHIRDFTHKLLHEFFFKLMMICFSLLMMCCYSLLYFWHQWQPHSTISPFLIDGNTHAPLVIMLIFFLSPFDTNGKGNSPWQYLFPRALAILLTTAFLLNIILINFWKKLLLVFVGDTQKYRLGEAW